MTEPVSTNVTPNDQAELHQTLSRNISISLITNILYLITRLFIPPFILHYISLADYGIWSYCFILISYLGMSVFGITNVYVRYAAVYAANGEVGKINRLVSTGIISVALLCAILLPLLYIAIPLILELFNITPEFSETAFFLIFGTMLIFMIDLTVGAFGYVLQSLQKIAAERLIWTASYLVETACIVFFLMAGFGVYGLLYAFIIRTLIAISLYVVACYKVLPGLSIGWKHFDKSMLKLFYKFGGIVQISGLLGVLNRSIEKLIAGFFIGVEATGLYEIGEKFPIMSLMLPGAISTAFLPASAHMHAREMQENMIETFIRVSRLINIITGLMMGFMAAFSSPLIISWIGIDKKYEAAASILAWFTIAYQMDVLTGPVSAIYRSINKPLREWAYGILQLLLVVAAAFIGFMQFGYTIQVINVSVATMMVASALIYIGWNNSYLRISQLKYLVEVIFPGLIPYAFGYGLFALFAPWFANFRDHRTDTFLLLFLAWVIYVMIVPSFFYAFFCHKEEKKWIRSRIAKPFQFLIKK